MGLNVVTAYIPGGLREEAANAIHDAISLHPDVTWRQHELDPDNVHEYGLILRDYWDSAQNDLFIVEPDIVIRPDAIQEIRDCYCRYGGFAYAWTTNVGVALGATWFKTEFMREYPDLMARAVATNVGWKQLDVVLQRHILVRELNIQPHVHLPAVEHLNLSKTLIEGADPTPLQSLPAW